MKLSKRLRKWKANLTTQTPVDYVITLREDINGFADEVKALEAENAKLRMCLGDGCADCAVGMGEYADSLCDPLKAENANLKERISQLEYERMIMFLELAGQWIKVKQREMEEE